MHRLLAIVSSLVVGLFAVAGSVSPAMATGHLLPLFTTSELGNWEADRAYPTDGVNSVTKFARHHVAQLGINSTEPAAGTFERTEGIKTTGIENFGHSVQVDLYLDPDWDNKAVRAGFWVVGDNGSGQRDEKYGILEFVHLEPRITGNSAIGDHEGWRFWDSSDGWHNLTAPYTYGEWVTLKIELDTLDQEYDYFINDNFVGSATGGANFIRELFLNSYNYGFDTFPNNLSNTSYKAHWHSGMELTNKDQCKKGGWESFNNPTFKNQGDCVSFLASGGKAKGNPVVNFFQGLFR